jgi:tRNA pseudouridine-54 N-methylase
MSVKLPYNCRKFLLVLFACESGANCTQKALNVLHWVVMSCTNIALFIVHHYIKNIFVFLLLHGKGNASKGRKVYQNSMNQNIFTEILQKLKKVITACIGFWKREKHEGNE